MIAEIRTLKDELRRYLDRIMVGSDFFEVIDSICRDLDHAYNRLYLFLCERNMRHLFRVIERL